MAEYSAQDAKIFGIDAADHVMSVFDASLPELARNALYISAFPLLTAIYGARGMAEGPLRPTHFESKVIGYLHVNLETLCEWYSPLIPVGFAFLRYKAETVGYAAYFYGVQESLLKSTMRDQFWDTASRVTGGLLWTCGLTGFWALGMWIRRRRAADKSLFGAPEISQVALSVLLFPLMFCPGMLHPAHE
ncbi:hypothetical protein CJU89_5483 [Yarrowia sp. B02]|nr:hypothetical protein CJU89_5483 [Yarrowia sp. B02]